MSAVAFILDYAGCKYNPHPYVMTDEWRKYCDSCRGNLLWSWRASSLRCREFEVSYADPKVPVELKSPEAALKAAALHLLPEAVLPLLSHTNLLWPTRGGRSFAQEKASGLTVHRVPG